MANTAGVALEIAGTGHVYYANPDTNPPDLGDYTFGDGTTLEAQGWTWLGDTSKKNMIENDTDGGDTTTKDTWDRRAVKSTREAIKNTLTINSVNLSEDTFKVAFPGSTYDQAAKAWDIELDGTQEKSFLIVVESDGAVSAHLYRRCSVGGTLPAFSDEEFTEVKLSATLLTPLSGKKKYTFFEPRKPTGKSAGIPTITTVTPNTGKAGTLITIEGTNFLGTHTVSVGWKAAQFTVVSATKITATVPPNAGNQGVAVINGKGSSAMKEFTVTQ